MFEDLYKVNVNGHTETLKQGKTELTYLSWTWAWAEIKKRYENAEYQIHMFADEHGTLLPYMFDAKTGYMVMTSVTIEGVTHSMWLPVMDGANKAMKDVEYTYDVKEYVSGRWTGNFTQKSVQPATMFDINKTIMRCLVKNLAMFGLGLYIYAGEDLPEGDEQKTEEKPKVRETYICSSCGNPIEDTVNSDGNVYSAERCYDASQKKFGVPLCKKCMLERLTKSVGVDLNE